LFGLASVHGYARLVGLYERAMGVAQADISAKRKARELNSASRFLAISGAKFGDEVVNRAIEDFGEGASEVAEIEQIVREECSGAAFRLLIKIADLSDGPFIATDTGLSVEPHALERLQSVVPEIGATPNLLAVFARALLIAQRLIGRQLIVYGERLDTATLLVRRLAAEVFDGAPMLMQAEIDDAKGKLELGGKVTPEPLHLGEAATLHRARRLAEPLLRSTEERETTTDEGAASNDKTPVEEEAPASAPPESLAPDPSEEIVDLRALAQSATELADDLEKVWSDGLEPSTLGAAQEQFRARIGGLLTTIQRRMSASDEALRAAGIDPTLSAFPPPPEVIAAIAFAPDREPRVRQLQNAVVEALMLLVSAVKAMNEPSAERISFVREQEALKQTKIETWWEAGAFSLVRERARLLVRLAEELEIAQAEFLGERSPELWPTFFDHLQLARNALSHADVEAVFIHSAFALRLCAGIADEMPLRSLCTRLAADDRAGETRFLLDRLDETLTQIGRGAPLDLGAATLLAPRVLELVGWLCLEAKTLVDDAAKAAGGDE
jgi:hypothetical protein